jgi:hypothetical protein
MTCTHVIGLIDAGPFVDYPSEHREAAWRHARQCATCGPALDAVDAVTSSLRVLPDPILSRDLTADVLARVAAVEQARGAMPAPAMVTAPATSRAVWVSGSATALAAAAAAALIASGDAPLFRMAPFSGGGLHMPSTGSGMAQLVTALALYAYGLLAPLRSSRRLRSTSA